MRIVDFSAVADIVGHRIAVSWTFAFDAGEGLDALPGVMLRRKTRDFEFPPSTAADPFLVYASAAFPPPGTDAVEIDLGGEHGSLGARVLRTVVSAATRDAQPFELLRRTRTIEVAGDGSVTSVTDSVLDLAARREGLPAGTTHYYQLTSAAEPDLVLRSAATATATHGSARTIYEQLPAIHRRHDVQLPAPRRTGHVPEAIAVNGQLRRFVDLFGAVADHVRSRADGLRDLRDLDDVDHRLLPHLAGMIGWELNTSQPIPLQRHEIRYAPQLYGLTGSVPGCLAWFKRLTGWDAQLHEFWRNVFLTNDLGNPADPADRGSRTVDATDAAATAAMGTAADTVDYTYDTAVGPEHWYAHNVVGFFTTPDSTDTIDDVVRKRGRVLSSVDRFLPCNMRAVVIVDTPTESPKSEPSFALTSATDQGG